MTPQRKKFLFLLSLMVFFGTYIVAGKDAPNIGKDTVKVKMPCLTVSEVYGGKLSYLPISISRGKEDVPLRVMIVDDTPNGSGQSIHSSIWMASVLAAMLRNDTMHGVTITVEFTGNVDGPSAGGVTCLTILSALDGLSLPTDFAMTGTILPDGTIGVVGGIPDKMRAAAKAGVKRIFIPAFQRIVKEKKGDTVTDIDLQRLADELKIELFFVENIFEAYSILHNRPLNRGGYTNIRQVTRLSPETEKVLMEHYNKYLELVKERVKKSPENSKIVISDGYALSPTLAQSLYQEGKLLPAAITMFHCWQSWQALDKANAFLEKFSLKKPDWSRIEYLREYHLRKLILALLDDIDDFTKQNIDDRQKKSDEYLAKHFGSNDGKKRVGFFPNSDKMTEITAQLEPIGMGERLLGELDTLFSRRLTKEQLEKASLKELEGAWANEMDILNLLSLVLLDDAEYNDFLRELGETLPKLNSTPRSKEVERLFYSAAMAVDAVANDNYRASAQNASAEPEAQEQADLENPILNPYLELLENTASYHSLLLSDSPEKPTHEKYHLQASLKANIAKFSMASALVVWYGPDRSNDFLPHLWRIARQSAVQNISECMAAGVPCVSAIYDFEMAEASINASESPIWGLMSYWKASLYSKALLMSFK
ncbi:MAG: S16 family serine protease [Bacillota bacterium]|jgi:hypothetical protein